MPNPFPTYFLRVNLDLFLLITQDMITKEVRIRELTLLAEKLKVEHYQEYEMIREMIEVRICFNYQVYY